MVAEERITTKFSGLVGAYGSEEEATFLATQQVDEARHMQFYARFQDEVIADPAAIEDHVARSRERLSPAFAQVFDDAGAGARAAGSSRATRRSTTTSTATSATEPGTCSRRWRSTLRWPPRFARPCATCFPRWPHRSPHPTMATPPTGTRSARADEIHAFALNGLDRRLNIIGVELA